ncbi:hypothetical protein V6617_01805 [Pelagibacterium nitratireducens]|uniref:Uncharacterized protein n=1 Tax=Pelagibacterium nitratireducens TaxID=1046114 RepID=A0ABZ2I048_9HYPH
MSTSNEDLCHSSPVSANNKLAAAIDCVIVALGDEDARISGERLAALISGATRCYVQRLQRGDEYFSPFHPDTEITATEAMILSTEVLKSADLQLFELGMWQAMGSPT